MASYEKLIRDVLKNSKDRPWHDMERILLREGCRRKKGKSKKGSHQTYLYGDVIIPVVTKHGRTMKRWCVEQIIELLNLREKYGE